MNENVDLRYNEALKLILEQIAVSQVKTVVAANSQLLWAYHNIGQIILQRSKSQGWGAKTIQKLSEDIRKQYPMIKGFSPRILLYMKQFAESYPYAIVMVFNTLWNQVKSNAQQAVALLHSGEFTDFQFTQQAVAQLNEDEFMQSILAKISWSHHIILLDKCPSFPERFWYMINSLEHGISRNILSMQIESDLYKRQVKNKKTSNFSATLPAPDSDFANYLLKDPYIFDFIQAKEKADERNIESQLTQHITKFLLELGQGFAFVGRQYHLHIEENDYFVDLLFYHVKLHCYVVVELKAREFDPGDTAQLNFYINVINDTVKSGNDNDTIGLLLCKGKNSVLAEYALKGFRQPIGIADYLLSKAVPENLKSELPNIDELERQLAQNDK